MARYCSHSHKSVNSKIQIENRFTRDWFRGHYLDYPHTRRFSLQCGTNEMEAAGKLALNSGVDGCENPENELRPLSVNLNFLFPTLFKISRPIHWSSHKEQLSYLLLSSYFWPQQLTQAGWELNTCQKPVAGNIPYTCALIKQLTR